VYTPTGRKSYVDQEIDEEINMHVDREVCTIDTVVVVVAPSVDADDGDYYNDDGEKEIVQFIKYYFSNTCRFATDIHF